MSTLKPADRPLKVKVSAGGVMTIEIGVFTLAHAALRSPIAYDMADHKTGKPGMTRPDELYEVVNAIGFAREVCAELTEEEEDGSSLLTNMLDEAFRKAIEAESQHFESKDGSDE